ncbi:hypothetical protein CYY_008674 [Polysphondylium violaceum]|uniref:Uncharacterized protein n=1 Tax=Polysphondylium violaceum TaxID=133409 RepID=A0A8J4V3P4_9MYCE|nr:hypothetical protein CYY_008674 [Polysphondylium violaceum]
MFKQSLIFFALCVIFVATAESVTNAPIVMGNDPNLEHVVKIFNHWDFEGDVFVYNATDGYVQLPNQFWKRAESFQSGIDACFVKFHPREQYQIKAGDYHRNYAALCNFGQRMDGLYAGSCTESICPL